MAALALDDPSAGARGLTVSRPALFRAVFHRFLALAGFRRHSLGGFGATLPEPSSGGGG